MPLGKKAQKIYSWIRRGSAVSACLILTCFAAWAAGITVPEGSRLRVNSGTLKVELDTPGSLNIGGEVSTTTGTIRLNGDWTATGIGSYLAGNGHVYFTGNGVQSLTPGTVEADGFWDLAHVGVGTVQLLTNALDINGSFTNSAGRFDVAAIPVTVAGDWNNTADFFSSGLVTLDGGNQSLLGSTTFYDLSKQVLTGADYQLVFANTLMQTVTHSLILAGYDADHLLALRSDSDGVAARLVLQNTGIQQIQYVDVKDNNASGGLTLVGRNSPDHETGSNNQNWLFNGVQIKWDGSADTNWNNPFNWDLGIVPVMGDTAIIRSVDGLGGAIPRQPRLVGNVRVLNLEIQPGASVTLDQHSLTIDANWVHQGNLILDGMEHVTANALNNTGTFTYVGMQNGELINADISGNFVIGGAALASFYDLVFQEENIASQRDTFILSQPLVVAHDFVLNEGNLTPRAAMTVQNNALVAGGVMDVSAYEASFAAQTALTVSNGQLIAINGNIDVGNIILSGGTLSAPNAAHSFTVAGDFDHSVIPSTFTANGGTVTFDGTDQTIYGSTSFAGLAKIVPVSAASHLTLTMQAASEQMVSGQLTLSGFDNDHLLKIRSTVDGTQALLTLSAGGTQTISRVDVEDSSANNGISLVARYSEDKSGVTYNNTKWIFGVPVVQWDGSASTDWGVPANWDLGFVPFTGDSVIVPLAVPRQPHLTAVSGPAVLSDLTLDSGSSLTLDTYGLTVTGTFSNEGTVVLQGNESLSISHPDDNTGTFYYAGDNTGNQYFITDGTRPAVFNNVVVNDANGTKNIFVFNKDVTINGSLTVTAGTLNAGSNALDLNGTLALAGGTFVAPGSGKAFTVAGDFTHSASAIFTANGGTVTLDAAIAAPGSVDQAITGSTTFYDLVKTVPLTATGTHSLTFDAAGLQAVTHSLTLTSLSGTPLILQSSNPGALNPLDRQWSISLPAGNQQFISSVDVTNSDASGGGPLFARASVDQSAPSFNNLNWIFGVPTLRWDGSVSSDWDNPLNWDLGLAPVAGDRVIIRSIDPLLPPANQAIPFQPVLNGNVILDSLELQTNSNLTLDGHGLSVAGAFSNEGNITLKGSETVAITNSDINSGRFTYIGDGSNDIPLQPFAAGDLLVKYFDLVIADSVISHKYEPQVDLAVYGSVTVSGGTLAIPLHNMNVAHDVILNGGGLSAPGTGHVLTLGGNWNNAGGTFTANGGRVVLDTVAPATISGNNTFFDLTSVIPGKTIRFESGATQTVDHNLTLSGSLDNKLVLRSTVDNGKWMLNMPGAVQTVSDLDVQDSVAQGAGSGPNYIRAFNSIDQQVSGESSNQGWWFINLNLLAPLDGRTTGERPVLIGQGPLNETVSIIDKVGAVVTVVATAAVNPDGNFRVELADGVQLAPGAHSLAVTFDGYTGRYSNVTVVASPAIAETPIIDSPIDQQLISGSRPFISGRGKPLTQVYLVINDDVGTLPLTLSPRNYAALGTTLDDGTFVIRPDLPLPQGIIYVSVIVDGVSSPLMTYRLHDVHGVVFDSTTNNPLKGVSVYIYKSDGTLAQTGGSAELDVSDVNPFVTGEDGKYHFLPNSGDYYLSIKETAYKYPSDVPLENLPAGRSVVAGSRGEVFSTNLAETIDLPVDGSESLFKIEKNANKLEVRVGDIVTYSVRIENLSSSNSVSQVKLNDLIPAGFKYVNARVNLDNVPIADPAGNRPLTFDVGQFLPSQVKTIRYQLVVGSGAGPGRYENTAYMKYSNGRAVSNRATETVTVTLDPLFDLGTVFGKVYYDLNENGRQDAPDYIYEERRQIVEGPVANVRIVMEDGTIITTDKNGQFHAPKLLPGRHLLRVDESTLPAGAYLTTDKVSVIDVTAGSIIKVNFGVNLSNGEALDDNAQFFQEKILINQDAGTLKPRLNVDMFKGEILLYNGVVIDQPEFRAFTNYLPFITSWKLEIRDRDTKRLVRDFSGSRNNYYDPLFWDGRDTDGQYVSVNKKYSYVLKVEGADGRWDETSEKQTTVRELTDQEWEARNLKKDENALAAEVRETAKAHHAWVLAQAAIDATAVQVIALSGETLRIDPLSADLRQVRLLQNGQLFTDIPVPGRHAMTAMDLADGTEQKQEPLEIIIPVGDYEIEVVSGQEVLQQSGEEAAAELASTGLTGSAISSSGTAQTEPEGGEGAVKIASFRRPLKVGEDRMLFVALGDGKAGYNFNTGSVETIQSGDKHQPGFYREGKMAYYLKGKIKGKYLVTSSFDTDRKQKEMFRSLKDDEYYAVYGDQSSVNYDATNTQGPLYLLVEWDKSQAIWGNYAVDFNDTEFARFTRTLYGGKVDYTSVAANPYGDARTRVAVFHAQVQQRSDHNEFLGTGGSLYYFKHAGIVTGSDNVRVEVRDAITGLVRSTVAMKAGVDYDIDYGAGRILFWKPVAMSADSSSIIGNGLLAGDPVYVVADYEYEVNDILSDSTQGVRLAQGVGKNVVAGATYVKETQPSGNTYELKGQDMTLRLSKDSTVQAEYSESTAQDSSAYMSTDGGITFAAVNGATNISGRAYGLRQDARLFDRIGLASYYKWVDPGFSTSGSSSQQGKELKGINMTFDLTPVTRLTASHEIQKLIEQGNLQTQMQVGAQQTTTTAIQLVHEAKRLRLAYEYRSQQVTGKSDKYQSAANTVTNTAAVQADYVLNEKTDLLLKHQQDLSAGTGGETTVGVKRKLTDKLTGTLEESVGSAGIGTKAGLTANVAEKLALTTEYGLVKVKGGERRATTTVAADSQVGQGLAVKTALSQTVSSTGANEQTASVGTKGKINDKTALETMAGVTQISGGGQRNALGVSGSTEIDGSTLKAGVQNSVAKDGASVKALALDAVKRNADGRETASGAKIEDGGAAGKKTVLTLAEKGKLSDNKQMVVERSFGFGHSLQEKADTYRMVSQKDGRNLETSYARKYSDAQAEHSLSNIFGLTGDINDRWAANGSLEQGKVQNADGSQTDRIALSGGVGYLEKDPETGTERFKSSTKAEIRLDSGAVDKVQGVFMQSAEGKIDDETTLSGTLNLSRTKNRDTHAVEAQYTEVMLGAAYRPIAFDRLNMFGRYTYKDNQAPAGQINAADIERTKMHVLSVEGAYDINEDWQIVERLAYRVMEEKVAGFPFTQTHTWMQANRVNYRIDQDWKVGVEYRVLTQQESRDQKRGFLAEATRNMNDNLELGIGYNFTSFVDDLTSLDYSAAGPFIRMTGKLYDRSPEERANARNKWLERRIELYAWAMVNKELKQKDDPVVRELNQMYQMAGTAYDLGKLQESRQVYKDIIRVTRIMYEEAADFVRQHIAFEERLYNASQRAREYFDKGEFWMAKKIWEKIVEEASKAVLK